MKWQHFKTIILAVAAVLSGFQPLPAAENDARIHLPVRITEGVYRFKPLTKEIIKLTVNGSPRDVAELMEKEKSISRTPELGRSFILSFNIIEYNQKISEAVSYFVTEVLNNSDMLFVFTPLNVFRVTVSRNKIKMAEDIEKLLNNDFTLFNKQRRSAERILKNRIKKLNHNFRNPMSPPGPFIATQNFLRYYISEYDNFNKQYILPNLQNYKQIVEFLGLREGERWCIHFQQRDTYSIIFKTRKIYKQLKGVFSSGLWGRNILTTTLSIFEGQLAQVESHTAEPLVKTLNNGNINFSSIVFGNLSERSTSATSNDGAYIEKIFKDTAKRSGGIDVVSSNPLEGIRKIIRHRDRFYELTFNFNQKIEDKKIKIYLLGSPTKPAYKEIFPQTEIHKLIQYLATQKVTIHNTLLNGNAIKFSINSFELQENNNAKFGILKVRIQLFDQWGEQVYNTNRILRASGNNKENNNSVNINHSLPQEYKGKYTLMISITDLLRNSQTSLTRQIDL